MQTQLKSVVVLSTKLSVDVNIEIHLFGKFNGMELRMQKVNVLEKLEN